MTSCKLYPMEWIQSYNLNYQIFGNRTMNTDARHHHYLPQCYLKGFTEKGVKKPKLFAFDLKQRRVFKTRPRNVGGCRDFNRVNIENVPPTLLEGQLSTFESGLATALREVQSSQTFSDEAKEYILNLIALLASRLPKRRKQWNKFESEEVERVMDIMLESKDRWEASTTISEEDQVTYEEAKAFHDEKQYTIFVPTERHIFREMKEIEVIVPLLYKRNWLLLVSPNEASPFITTDNPVVLVWNHPEDIPLIYRDSPGFGMGDTTVQIALAKNIALIGEFNGKEGVLTATPELVAVINSRALIFATGQIYAPSISWMFMWTNNSLIQGKEIFSIIPDNH